jgi:glycosyltransferase involved in cell wall biosynthesis
MFDIVTWVKNGGWCLPRTLLQLEKALPSNFIHRKIAIDDASTDDSVKILKSFGWEVYKNRGKGISAGANYALQLVDCPYFMSFEQDLLLSQNWFNNVTPLVKGNIAAASGIRFSDKAKTVRDIEQYVYKKYLMETRLASYLQDRKESAFLLGKTLDNTFYNTKIIRSIGGFPFMSASSGIDTLLAYRIREKGFKWIVNPEVQSIHLRKNFTQNLSHQYWYSSALKEVKLREPNFTINLKQEIKKLVTSPFTGFLMSFKMKNPKIFVVYPLLRFYRLRGFLSV